GSAPLRPVPCQRIDGQRNSNNHCKTNSSCLFHSTNPLLICVYLVSLFLSKCVQGRNCSHDQESIGYRGRRHHHFAHRILREQLVLLSSLYHEYVAVFAGEINLAFGSDW